MAEGFARFDRPASRHAFCSLYLSGKGLALLKDFQVEAVRNLLGKESHRKIASIVGVGRSSVSRIARNRWAPKRRQRNEDPVFADLPKEKCGRCGAMVAMPCVKCATEAAIVTDGLRRRPDGPDEDPTVDLHGSDGERYRALCAKRFLAQHSIDGGEIITEKPRRSAADGQPVYESVDHAEFFEDPDAEEDGLG